MEFLVQKHHLELFADYHQFYVWDSGKDPAAPQDWSDEDVQRRVKVAPFVLVVQPERDMTIRVDLELHPDDPGFDESQWDHIVECSVNLPTGHLQVHECTGGAKLNLQVQPGTYRARVLFCGLGTISDDGLEGDDKYIVALWPGTSVDLKVVRQWPS